MGHRKANDLGRGSIMSPFKVCSVDVVEGGRGFALIAHGQINLSA